MKSYLVALVWSASILVGKAQPVIVNPDGSGDHVDLQVALDSEPEGSTFVVHGTHRFVTIEKAARILGAAGALLTDIHGPAPFGYVLRIAADPTDDVTLVGLSIHAHDPRYASWNAIQVDSVGSLTVDQCTIDAGSAVDGDCSQNPFHGYGILDLSDSPLTVSRSTIRGGNGPWINDSDCCFFDLQGSPGGVGIAAAGTIVLIDSLVTGGDGGNVEWGCPAGPPNSLDGGDGGNAVEGELYQSNSILLPGKGGVYLYENINWGVGTRGADGLTVAGPMTVLPDQLDVPPAPIGGAFDLRATGFAPGSTVLALVGTGPLVPPYASSRGLWFLQQILLVRPMPVDAAGVARLQGTIASNTRLIGDTIWFQVINMTTWTEPSILVIEAP